MTTQPLSTKRQLLGIIIVLGAIIIFYFVCNRSVDRLIGNTCDIQMYSSETPLTALFNHVKYYDYCSKYSVYIEGQDNYGKIVWKLAGYYTLTKEEYNEMRKYGDAIYYANDHPDSPKFSSEY